MEAIMLAKRTEERIYLWFELIIPYGLVLTAQNTKRALKLLIAQKC